jgi:hypothetical protein
MADLCEWPDWLPGVARIPDDQYAAGQLRRLVRPPLGIVLHSGDTAPNVAEYITTHRYSYHFAWSHRMQQLVQTVPLTHRAQHAGSANGWLGVAFSGPDEQNPRRPEELAEWRRVGGILVSAMPCLRYWCRHSDLSARKRDPGPGVTEAWMDGMGLAWWVPRR